MPGRRNGPESVTEKLIVVKNSGPLQHDVSLSVSAESIQATQTRHKIMLMLAPNIAGNHNICWYLIMAACDGYVRL